MFNLRNVECQRDFKDKTTNTARFSQCFKGQENIEVRFKRWKRRLIKALYTSFQKIRIKEGNDKKLSNMDILMGEKKTILKKKELSREDKDKIDTIDEEISIECEDKEYQKLENILESLETDSGSTTVTKIWKQMRKSFPSKSKPLPTGIKNIEGKVITNPEEKKRLILDHFRHWMRKRPVKQDIRDIFEDNEKLFKKRVGLAQNVKSDSFSMKELESILKSLMAGKSRDPDYLVCEIFKEGVIGEDLKLSILVIHE